MATEQSTGRVLRSLPAGRVVVRLSGGSEVTATCPGLAPRRNANVFVFFFRSGWVVSSWHN